MAGRGPQPTPTRVLEARGSRLAVGRDGEPRVPVEAPTCPRELSDEAKAEWRRVVKQLKAAGLIATMDRGQLAAYCDAWGDFIRAVRQIAALEKRYKGKGFERAIRAGLVAAKAKASDRLTRIADRFGFSPAARTRVKASDVVATDAKHGDKARFFKTVG